MGRKLDTWVGRNISSTSYTPEHMIKVPDLIQFAVFALNHRVSISRCSQSRIDRSGGVCMVLAWDDAGRGQILPNVETQS